MTNLPPYITNEPEKQINTPFILINYPLTNNLPYLSSNSRLLRGRLCRDTHNTEPKERSLMTQVFCSARGRNVDKREEV
jgi:hypothetical protein